MRLTTAQQLIHSFFAKNAPGPFYYKAPHAPQGTPPRKRNKASQRPRLFKGHRP